MMQDLVFAFVQGVITFFAPCAVALLPGYIAAFVARNPEEGNKFKRASMLAFFSMSGIILIYAVVGVLIFSFNRIVKIWIPYISFGLGVLLLLLGIAMMLGKSISINLHLKKVKTNNEMLESFIFGIAYGIGAVGCLFPLFLVILTTALASGSLALTVLNVGSYALGMAVFMVAFTFLSVYAKDWLQQKLRYMLPRINRIAGFLVFVAGIYVMYYQSALVF